MRVTLTTEEWTRLDALMGLASAHVAAVEALAGAVARLVDVRRGSVEDGVVDQALFTGQTGVELLARLAIDVDTRPY